MSASKNQMFCSSFVHCEPRLRSQSTGCFPFIHPSIIDPVFLTPTHTHTYTPFNLSYISRGHWESLIDLHIHVSGLRRKLENTEKTQKGRPALRSWTSSSAVTGLPTKAPCHHSSQSFICKHSNKFSIASCIFLIGKFWPCKMPASSITNGNKITLSQAANKSGLHEKPKKTISSCWQPAPQVLKALSWPASC